MFNGKALSVFVLPILMAAPTVASASLILDPDGITCEFNSADCPTPSAFLINGFAGFMLSNGLSVGLSEDDTGIFVQISNVTLDDILVLDGDTITLGDLEWGILPGQVDSFMADGGGGFSGIATPSHTSNSVSVTLTAGTFVAGSGYF